MYIDLNARLVRLGVHDERRDQFPDTLIKRGIVVAAREGASEVCHVAAVSIERCRVQRDHAVGLGRAGDARGDAGALGLKFLDAWHDGFERDALRDGIDQPRRPLAANLTAQSPGSPAALPQRAILIHQLRPRNSASRLCSDAAIVALTQIGLAALDGRS